jgi:Mg2+ and Co2+ transporter CorA
MKTTCFSIDTTGRARGVELDEAIAGRRDESGLAWIDAEAATRDEATTLLSGLGLDAGLIDEILERGHAARTIPFDGGLYFELPLEIAGRPAELTSIGFVCLDGLLVTLRREIRDTSSWVGADQIPRLDLGDGTTPSLVSALMVELSLQLRGRSLDGRRVLTELADRLDEDPGAVSAHEIAALKRTIFDLDAISEERAASLESLRSADRFFRASPDAAERLGIAQLNTAATTRRLDRLDRRAEALQARVDAVAQERINRRLSRLTIISAVFLPLTLIAGIYGMNFEVMPELGFRYAYPLTLVGMVVITFGLLVWFKRGGWMD